MNYRQYLKTPTWQNLRMQAIERAKVKMGSANLFGVCEKCGYEPWKPGVIQVHHVRYPGRWGSESLDDLECLCVKCHRELHQKEKQGKEQTKSLGGINITKKE